MAESNTPNEVKEYADGWITERKGTDVPGFLKACYIVIAAGAIAYILVYMFGEVNNADRGALVKAFNAATQTSPGFMYFVMALAAVFFILMIKFAFSKFHED